MEAVPRSWNALNVRLETTWVEKQFATAIVVDGEHSKSPTHSVDCFKGRVALEVEWNNKDPFYDRDLNNFRLLFDLQVIDVGVIITRCSTFRTSSIRLVREQASAPRRPI